MLKHLSRINQRALLIVAGVIALIAAVLDITSASPWWTSVLSPLAVFLAVIALLIDRTGRTGRKVLLGVLATGALVAVGLLVANTAVVLSSRNEATPPLATCVIAEENHDGYITRYDAGPAGSKWWVSYALLTNPCDRPITLTSIERTGVLEPGFDWTGKALVGWPSARQPAQAFFTQEPDSRIWSTPLEGAVLRPGQTVQVLVELTLVEAKAPARQVPPAKLSWSTNNSKDSLTLQPILRLCGCATE